MDDDPRNFQGRGIIAVLHLLSQTVREVMAIVVILVGFVSVRLLLFHCMPASRHSDSTPDIRCVFLCVHDYRALRTVCTVPGALQTTAAVVSSHEVVCGGNGRNSMLYG